MVPEDDFPDIGFWVEVSFAFKKALAYDRLGVQCREQWGKTFQLYNQIKAQLLSLELEGVKSNNVN